MLLVHCRHSVSVTQISTNQNRCRKAFPVPFSVGPLQDCISQDLRIEGLKVSFLSESYAQLNPAAFTLIPGIQTDCQCPKSQGKQEIQKILLS